MLVLDRAQVETLLDLDALIDALAVAMVDQSRGVASVPDRLGALVPDRDGLLAVMPGFVPSVPSAGVLMCGCRTGHPGFATWAYSSINPPSKSRRRR
jgi:alanine dehydrogenase